MSEQGTASAEHAAYTHPKRIVNPANRVEQWRTKQPSGSFRRWLFDVAALPVDEPGEFTLDRERLAEQLVPKDGSVAEKTARAEEILKEAQKIYEDAEDRAAGATTRATTLQEAVGIAATLLIAGAGLIVGQTALNGFGWVIAFAVLLFGATVSLVMSGLRALGSASTIHVWYRPTAVDIVKRAQLPELDARLDLAADTLICYGYNTKVAAWKVAYLGASAWWYRIALAFIVSIAMLVGIYAVFGVSHGSVKAMTALERCRTPQLSVHLGFKGAALGTAVQTVIFTNTSATRCFLDGYPTLQMLNSAGAQLHTISVQGSTAKGISEYGFPTRARRVALTPRASASFAMAFADGTGFTPGSCPTSAYVEVIPPDSHTPIRAKWHLDPYGEFSTRPLTLKRTHCGGIIVSPIVAGTRKRV
jgi:hypothetical protein